MRKILLIITALILASCARQPQNAPPQTAKSAILGKVYDKEIYKGKSCRLRTEVGKNGLLNSIEAEGGNPELCQALIVASRSDDLPKMQPGELTTDFAL